MDFFTARGAFAFHRLLLTLCLLLPVFLLPAQKPTKPDTKTTLNFCGSLHPHRGHGDLKPIKPVVPDGEEVYSDRFGNYYSGEELAMPKGTSVGEGSNIKLQTGYFNPIYHEVPADVQALINTVLLEVSNEIVQRQGIDECSQNYSLNLDILWGDFADRGAEVWTGIDANSLPLPATGILGIGSPFYERTTSSHCLGMAADRPFSKVNGGWVRQPNLIDGRILLNSNLTDYTPNPPTGNYSYWLNEVEDPARPNTLEFDLHTIFLHELLHVLGIASRIDPELTGSSRYDLELRVQDNAGNNSPLLIPNPATPGCYTGHPEINDFLFNNCNDDRSIGFRASDEIAMQDGTYSVAEIGNGFSHFTNICGTDANYVLLPGLNPGQARRTISPEELGIFCDMGYHTSSSDCKGCFVMGWNDTNGRLGTYDQCSSYLEICAGVPTTFSLSQITRLHTNGTDVEWGTPFVLINANSNLFGSSVDFVISGDEVTVTVSPNSQGDMNVRFPVTACEDGQITILTHPFAVSAICGECDQSQIDDCGNVSCSTDFENYPHTNAFITFGELTKNLDLPYVAPPRLRHSTNPDNNHVYIGRTTPATFELSSQLLPGCSVTINLDAVLTNVPATINFWGSEVRMCSANEVLRGVPFDCQDSGTDCGDEIFIPRCLGTTDEILMGGPLLQDAGDLTISPPFQNYSFTFTNESDDVLNFIYLIPEEGDCWIDNISMTISCPVILTTTITAVDAFCAGDVQPVSFEICNNSPEAAVISAKVEERDGWRFFESFEDLPLSANGGCTTITIQVRPDTDIDAGSYDFNLSISAINQCGLVDNIDEAFTLTTEECIQQFDCTVPNADLVGQTTCNRRISDIAESNTTQQSFCPIPDVVVTWPENGVSNATIIVENELIIDRNYTFTNCEFIMRPNSRITVASGRTLRITGSSTNQSWLHGCTALWEGINISGTGRIVVNNTRIQDAIVAINATESTRIRLAAVTLANNGIGVQMSGDKETTNVEVEIFVGVQLTRENALMPYTGTEPYTPTSIGVRTINNFIENTFGFVTDETPQSTLWNRQRIIYRNLEVGIKIEGGASQTVVHSLFEQTGSVSGTGIELVGTNVAVRGMGQGVVSFSNLDQGIRATEYSYIDASDNLVDGCRLGFSSTGDGTVDINENTFTNVGLSAISYRNNNIKFTNTNSISGNTITLDAPGFTGGINVVNNRPKRGNTLINNNAITLSGEAGVGIRLKGNRMSLSGNNIMTTNVNSSTTGIEFREGRDNTANLNIISGMGANSNSVGVTVGSQGQANPYLKCNLFDNLADGIAVLSTGTGLRIIGNEFAGEMNAGVYFGPQHTSFLRHQNGRNQWTGTFAVGALVSDLPSGTQNAAAVLDGQRWTIASNLFPPLVTVLNFPQFANIWVVQGPAANFIPCAPTTDGFTTIPGKSTGKSLATNTGKPAVPAVADLKISPNPSLSSMVTVQTPELENQASLTVMDIYGRTLRNIEIPAGRVGAGRITLELPEKGFYFVVLRETGSGNAPIVKRVIRN